jgi:hypothetical protein
MEPMGVVEVWRSVRTPQLRKPSLHRRGPNAQPLTDSSQSPARRTKPHRFGDLFWQKTLPPYRRTLLLQQPADRLTRDLEPISQLIDRRTSFTGVSLQEWK